MSSTTKVIYFPASARGGCSLNIALGLGVAGVNSQDIMIEYQGNLLLVYNNCVPLVKAFLLGAAFLAMGILGLCFMPEAKWWLQWVYGLVIVMSLAFLALNLRSWYLKVKHIPLCVLDGERIVSLALKRWEAPLAEVEGLLFQRRAAKMIHAYLSGGVSRLLIPAYSVSDVEEVFQVLNAYIEAHQPWVNPNPMNEQLQS